MTNGSFDGDVTVIIKTQKKAQICDAISIQASLRFF